mmetsp:Transcript_6362/g.15485  ORF Transcript_6362/g.15485 Transcript_6362/m.15485 type:complete len:128 (+) Transcript_6362:2-385(+)
MMKHHGFTAREAIGYIRLMRPGSVIGPQQEFLEAVELHGTWEGNRLAFESGGGSFGDAERSAQMARDVAAAVRGGRPEVAPARKCEPAPKSKGSTPTNRASGHQPFSTGPGGVRDRLRVRLGADKCG